MKRQGRIRRCRSSNQNRPTHERGIPMPSTIFQKGDHIMKHVIFIILGAVTVMCLALATGYLQP